MVGAVLLLFGGTLAGLRLLVDLPRAMASRRWPAVPGELQSAAVKERRHRGRNGDSYSYSVMARYSYQVDGVRYDGHRIRLVEDGWNDRFRAAMAAKDLQRRTALAVHHDPADPSMAVLQVGVPRNLMLEIGIGLVFTLVGAVFLLSRTFG